MNDYPGIELGEATIDLDSGEIVPPPAPAAGSAALLPCPFCGGTDLEVVLYNRPCVVCRSCDADGPSAQRLMPDPSQPDNRNAAKLEAVELWNRRQNAEAER